MEVFTYVLLFILGIIFGSFYTLAVYRIPKGENILYKHSYCPNCNHKLGFFDLIPVFSYLLLRGKCRYCHNKVRIRYLLLEVLSGIVFVLYGYSIKINLFNTSFFSIIMISFEILYFVGLFIIAGIDKEKNKIQSSVLWYLILIIMGYIIYICTLEKANAYIYVIYLCMMILTILADTYYLRKNTKSNYWIEIIILFIAMLMFNKAIVMLKTLEISIVTIIIYKLEKWIKENWYKYRQKDNIKDKKIPIGFILCVSNIISILIVNIIQQYSL